MIGIYLFYENWSTEAFRKTTVDLEPRGVFVGFDIAVIHQDISGRLAFSPARV
jgi:hypothetical protein